jgi:ketosteroid isomerase-like protein
MLAFREEPMITDTMSSSARRGRVAMAIEGPISPDDTRVYRAIEAGYNQFFEALEKKEIESLMSWLTEDFRWKLSDSEILDRRLAESMLQTQLNSFDSATMRATIFALSIQGTEAVVHLREEMSLTAQDASGAAQRMIVTEEYRDTWVRTDAGWKIRYGELLSSRTTIDSQPTEVAGAMGVNR